MRTTLAMVDSASQATPALQDALYGLIAETLVSQTLAAAAHRGEKIEDADARRWLEEVAGYTGVLIAKTGSGTRSIGEIAEERLLDLLKLG
jgi:hypothetical protein